MVGVVVVVLGVVVEGVVVVVDGVVVVVEGAVVVVDGVVVVVVVVVVGGGSGGVSPMRWVAADVASALPFLLVAVTLIRSVAPRSAVTTGWVVPV